MNKTSLKITTFVFLLSLIASFSAHAQYNSSYYLLAGFTQKGANSGGNDVIYCLGYAPGFSDGQTWDLSTTFNAQSFTITTTNFQWGAVGSYDTSLGSATNTFWVTSSGVAPDSMNGVSAFNNYNTPVKSINDAFPGGFAFGGSGVNYSVAASTDNSWNGQTIVSASPSSLKSTLGLSPNQLGVGSLTLWQLVDNNSSAQILGYLTLGTNKVLTFNKTLASAPPAPKIVNVTHIGTTSTVYFTTTNSFTYKLYYSTNLTTPIGSWPNVGSPVPGNGLTNSIADTTATGAMRFYRVGVQ